MIGRSKGGTKSDLKKDLKKLIKCLLKEDRNNLQLVVKFAGTLIIKYMYNYLITNNIAKNLFWRVYGKRLNGYDHFLA